MDGSRFKLLENHHTRGIIFFFHGLTRRWTRKRLAAVLVIWCSVALLYPSLYARRGEAISSLFALPILLSGWILGFWGGFAAAILATLIGFFASVTTEGLSSYLLSDRLLGIFLGLFTGVISGWISDLLASMKAQKVQLTEEIASRRQAQSSLEELNNNLEEMIAARTAQLTQTNEALCQQIEERQQVEAALSKSEKSLRQITDNMLDLISQVDVSGNYVYLTPSYQTVLGYAPESLAGKSMFENLHCDDLEQAVQIAQDAFQHNSPASMVLRYRHLDGHYLWMECIANPIFLAEGSIAGWVIMGRDITQRKEMEDQVQASLREKEILLKEIHHRVKNNLQIISSLLKLQAQEFPAGQMRDAFHESQSRVRSMALIHEKIYQSKNFAEINFGDYVSSLSDYLFYTYRTKEADVDINIQCQNLFLGIEAAVPIGLILNELISNALKHAFAGRKSGEVLIELSRKEDHSCHLVVADDGVGLPTGFDLSSAPTLGLQLVDILVKQINGNLQVSNGTGVRFDIAFKLAQGS